MSNFWGAYQTRGARFSRDPILCGIFLFSAHFPQATESVGTRTAIFTHDEVVAAHEENIRRQPSRRIGEADARKAEIADEEKGGKRPADEFRHARHHGQRGFSDAL